MMSKKKSFLFYHDQVESISKLPPELFKELVMAVAKYSESGIEPDLDPVMSALFSLFKSTIDRDGEKYSKICASRSEAGRKGGLAKASNAKQKKQSKANLADTEKDTDTEKDNDSVTDKKKTPRDLIAFAQGLVSDNSRKELVREWLEYRIEIKKPMKTERGLKAMVDEWSKYTNEQVRLVMDYTISKEYQGLIWEKAPKEQVPAPEKTSEAVLKGYK